MDGKTKLYLFARTEVLLIFLFVLAISSASFMLGVKVGRSYSYEEAGFKPEDRQRVDFLSGQEEKVNQLVREQGGLDSRVNLKVDEFNKRLEEKIQAELSKEEKKNKKKSRSRSKKDPYSGKHTVQIGSHRSLREAEAFADGFRVRGYNPIINEVQLPQRGTWYRVSLGVFETITQAKNFVRKEYSLFQGQDYVFVRFD